MISRMREGIDCADRASSASTALVASAAREAALSASGSQGLCVGGNTDAARRDARRDAYAGIALPRRVAVYESDMLKLLAT